MKPAPSRLKAASLPTDHAVALAGPWGKALRAKGVL